MTNYRFNTCKAFSVKTLSGIFKSVFWFFGLISIVRSLILQQYFRTGGDLWRKGSRLFLVDTYLAGNCNFFSLILIHTHLTARFFSLLDRDLRSSVLSWEPKVLQSLNSVWASFKLIYFCSLTVFSSPLLARFFTQTYYSTCTGKRAISRPQCKVQRSWANDSLNWVSIPKTVVKIISIFHMTKPNGVSAFKSRNTVGFGQRCC